MSRPVTALPLVIYADSREQAIPPMPPAVVVERITLHEGDYTTLRLLEIARIERKSREDFASSITSGRERFERELERLRAYEHRCIVVEANLSDFVEGRARSGVHPHSIVGTIASFATRWGCPTYFAHDAVYAGWLIAGLLRRWEEMHAPATVPHLQVDEQAEQAFGLTEQEEENVRARVCGRPARRVA